MSKTSGAAPSTLMASTPQRPAPRADANRWAWLPAMMPRVARLMEEHRARHGAAHVAECWRRGVVMQERGWFFAREGALAVGTPFDDAMLRDFGAFCLQPGQALLMLADPHGSAGIGSVRSGGR